MGHPFDDMLVCEQMIALSWERAIDLSPDNGLQTNQRNMRLLGLLNSFDESRSENPEEFSENSAALLRLEAKVDLLLDLFSDLLKKTPMDHQQCTVRLSAKGLEWESNAEHFESGEPLWISLRLDPKLPQPIKLLARVISSENNQNTVKTLVAFEGLSEELIDLLEKAVFRIHRRQVANRKTVRTFLT